MNTFTVYGGCVSRDIFNYLNSQIYKPALTIGQNPISTMFETPFTTELEDYHLGANFEKRMLYFDSNKLGLSQILESNSEYFIFDVICERITLMEFELKGKKGIVEKSWNFVDNWLEMLKTDKYKGMKKIRDINTADLGLEYEEKIDLFCDYISNKFPSDKIIFCELNLVNDYLDKEGRLKSFNIEDGYKTVSKYNEPKYANEVLERVTKRIKRKLPDIHYIPMPDGVIADARHHFGIHPLHYTKDYYQYAATAVELIVKLGKPELTRIPLMKLCELQSKGNKLIRNYYIHK